MKPFKLPKKFLGDLDAEVAAKLVVASADVALIVDGKGVIRDLALDSQRLVPIMIEEQRHTRMHSERLKALGFEFGDFAVNGHVWIQTRRFAEPLDYLACIPLMFEGSNLDHSAAYPEWKTLPPER